MHPAVYVDDDDVWHEKYWFLTFYDRLDGLDRKRTLLDSDDDDDVEEDEQKKGVDFNLEVDKFRLSEKVLDRIPEENRLVFKIDGASMGYVFIHQKIVNFFNSNGLTGIRFMKVSEFEEGDQFP